MTLTEFLTGIRGRLAAATPGPWYYYGLCSWLGNVIGTTPEETVIGPPATYPSLGDPDFSTSVIGVNYERFHGKEDDCKFIASAPTDLALAVDVIGVLVEALKFECGNRCAEQNPCNARDVLAMIDALLIRSRK